MNLGEFPSRFITNIFLKEVMKDMKTTITSINPFIEKIKNGEITAKRILKKWGLK